MNTYKVSKNEPNPTCPHGQIYRGSIVARLFGNHCMNNCKYNASKKITTKRNEIQCSYDDKVTNHKKFKPPEGVVAIIL